MKIVFNILAWMLVIVPGPLWAQQRETIAVAPFQVQGPAQWDYLGGAAQDAVIGSLQIKGYDARAYYKVMDPDKLSDVKFGKKDPGIIVAGRINVVGQAFRVRVKWVDRNGRSVEEYLQVPHVDQLLPELEKFAGQSIQPPPAAPVARAEKKEKIEAEPVPAEVPEAKTEAPVPAKREGEASPEKTVSPKKAAKEEAKEVETSALRDYRFISERLPFEVRGLAYGDVTGDGKKDVLLTSQRKLYLYRYHEGQLDLLAEYEGKRLDYFVKVDVLPATAGSPPYVMLTNIRYDQAASKVLKYSGGVFSTVAENIPFQLRVLEHGGEFQLFGAPYRASTPAWHDIYRLSFNGSEVQEVEKLNIPYQTNLYNYHRLSEASKGPYNLVVMMPSGKLRLYKEADHKFKKLVTSRETYGGSGNYIPLEVKNMFNEVVADYYALPTGVKSAMPGGGDEVIVVKNESLVKNVIGRVPVISSGRLFRLKYDDMGFVETWESQKVDGSIQDYQVTADAGKRQLLAAVRLRDPGLLGDINRKDSVLLVYDLD